MTIHPTPTGICPRCGGPAHQTERYPRQLCAGCVGRATDRSGRSVALSSGAGFVATHRDDASPCDQVTGDERVLIDGVEFSAREDYWGGVVVQPIEPADR
jgi:hypothetical protein